MNTRLASFLALAVALPPLALAAQTGTQDRLQERKMVQERHRLELKSLLEKQAEERKTLQERHRSEARLLDEQHTQVREERREQRMEKTGEKMERREKTGAGGERGK